MYVHWLCCLGILLGQHSSSIAPTAKLALSCAFASDGSNAEGSRVQPFSLPTSSHHTFCCRKIGSHSLTSSKLLPGKQVIHMTRALGPTSTRIVVEQKLPNLRTIGDRGRARLYQGGQEPQGQAGRSTQERTGLQEAVVGQLVAAEGRPHIKAGRAPWLLHLTR